MSSFYFALNFIVGPYNIQYSQDMDFWASVEANRFITFNKSMKKILIPYLIISVSQINIESEEIKCLILTI